MVALLLLTACLITEGDRAARLAKLRADGDGDGSDGAANTSDSGGGSDGGADGGSDGGADGAADGGSDGGSDGGTDDTSTPALVLDMIEIPDGEFDMGSPTEEEAEVGRQTNEQLHHVVLNQAFSIGRTELTRETYILVMGLAPPSDADCTDGDECPAAGLSWHEAVAFTVQLSEVEGLTPCYVLQEGSGTLYEPTGSPYDCEGYRLPTEAEWEYAARAGVSAAYQNGANLETWSDTCDTNDITAGSLSDFAWYCGSASGKAHGVGTAEPTPENPAGLVDVSGNLSEWCHDWYSADLLTGPMENPYGPSTPDIDEARVLRGGAFLSYPASLRLASRRYDDNGEAGYGLRLARTLK